MQVVVLAGGFGTRLRPWTRSVPKPMLPLLDRTLLERVIEGVPQGLVDEVVVAAGYRIDQLREHFAAAELPYDVTVVKETEPLGTGGALGNCRDHVSGRFACFNGDVVSSLDVAAMLEQHRRTGAAGTLGLWEVDDPTRYGIVGLDGERRVTRFQEKPAPEDVFSHLINAGNYLLEDDVFDLIPPGRSSLEREIFPRLAETGDLYGMPFEGYFVDAGTPASWQAAVRACIHHGRFAGGRRSGEGGWLGVGAEVADGARVVRSGVGEGSRLGRGAIVVDSSLLADVQAEAGVVLERCLVGREARVGAGAHLADVIVDHGAVVPPGTHLSGGTWPPDADAGADA